MVAHVPVLAEAVITGRVALSPVLHRHQRSYERVLRLGSAYRGVQHLSPVTVHPPGETGPVGEVVVQDYFAYPPPVIELYLPDVAYVELFWVNVEAFGSDGPEDESGGVVGGLHPAVRGEGVECQALRHASRLDAQ